MAENREGEGIVEPKKGTVRKILDALNPFKNMPPPPDEFQDALNRSTATSPPVEQPRPVQTRVPAKT